MTIGTALMSGAIAQAQEQPNIVLFLVDDMGPMDTSVPFVLDEHGVPQAQPLNHWYRTPNMEVLAEQGTRFTSFYAQSVSTPSRISILTGCNAARHQTTNWIHNEMNNRDDYGPFEWNWMGMDSHSQSYPRLLQEAGYKTIHVGKAHLGNNLSESADPTVVGYDVNIAGGTNGHPASYYGENGYGHIKGDKRVAVPGLEEYRGTKTHLTEALTLEAAKEVRKAVAEKRPFYLNMAHYAVHHPFEADPRFIDHYKDGSYSQIERGPEFATLIEGMDKSLGDLLHLFDELGIAENTLIIFLGDNGGDAPLGGAEDYGSCSPLRGKKGCAYEGGMRVPFIVSWAKPDGSNKFQQRYSIPAGGVQNQMATVMDLFPTIVEIAGAKTPSDYILDGSSIVKMMSGKKDKKHRDDFLMHFPHEHRSSYFTTYRKGNLKLIYRYNPETRVPTYELYDLKADPFEKNDLSSSKPAQVRRLTRLMVKRLEQEKALYPVDGEGRTIYPIIP